MLTDSTIRTQLKTIPKYKYYKCKLYTFYLWRSSFQKCGPMTARLLTVYTISLQRFITFSILNGRSCVYENNNNCFPKINNAQYYDYDGFSFYFLSRNIINYNNAARTYIIQFILFDMPR